MLVNITEYFIESGREWRIGENPDVPREVAARWIADGKATADTDGARDSQSTVSGGGGGSVTVENVLTSTSTENALSAAMGKSLKDTADALAVVVAGKADSALAPQPAVSSIAALRAVSVASMADLTTVHCSGYYAQNDGGGGWFVYSSGSVAADDGGAVIQPSSGSGRWFRIFPRTDQYNVRHWGAKGDYNGSTGTDDSVAVAACVTYAKNNKQAGTNINWVFFPEGWYYTRIPPVNYIDVAFEGAGIGLTRVRHVNGYSEPLIYVTGPATISTGARTIATPYGGTRNMSLQAGTLTYPAVHYSDVSVDQGYDMDGTAYAGPASTVGVSGMSCFDFLNAGMRRVRFDGIGKWGVDFRCSSVLTSVVDRTSGNYRATALNVGTGVWTITSSPEPILGTPAMIFGFGATAPTAVDTGLALLFAHQGGVYFVGVGSTSSAIVLYRTRADALAGTNAITYSASYSGSIAFCLWVANATVSAVTTGTDTITYNDGGRGFCVGTTVQDTTLSSAVIGTGYDNTLSTANGIHCVMLWSDGALPSPLVAGTVYWPTYVDAKNIKLSTTPANAYAGVFIDITDVGSGNIYLMYHHGAAAFGMGHYTLDDYTYDNSGATTMETRGGSAAGGYGVLAIDTSGVASNKGNIEISNTRVEINKYPARDATKGVTSATTFYARVNTNISGTEGSNVSFTLDGTAIDMSTSVATNTRDSIVISCQGNNDLSLSIRDLSCFGIGQAYNNQNGTAASAIALRGGQVRGYVPFASTKRNSADKNDGSARHVIDGVTVSRQDSSLTSAYNKRGDTLYAAPGTNPVLYRAIQAQAGLCKGTTGTPASIGVTGNMTVGSNIVTFTGTLNAQVSIGTAVSVVGAGAAAANLIGIVSTIDNYPASGSRTLTLVDSVGAAVLCSTAVTGAVINYADATYCQVDGYYAMSAALDFPSIAAGTSADLTIAAPGGVTLTAGRCVILGLPSNVPAGVIYNAFVSSSGTTVTVRASNITAAAVDPVSGTFNARVMA